MNYEEKMNELLKDHMTERGYEFWIALNKKIPPVWKRPTSSTGKYHKKREGYVPNVDEHTYDMLLSGTKIYRMFDIKKKTSDCDMILLGIAMHDIIKYGHENDRDHTHKEHDRLIADRIVEKKETFLQLLNEEQVDILIEMVRFHSGRWSADANINDFNFKDHHPYVLFVHMLDMLSAADCLR